MPSAEEETKGEDEMVGKILFVLCVYGIGTGRFKRWALKNGVGSPRGINWDRRPSLAGIVIRAR